MTERKFPNISPLGIVWKEPEDIQATHDEENKIPKIVKIPIDIFFRERPPPWLHVSFPPAGTSLKFNISPAGTPARPGRHPPPLWVTSPFSRWRRCLVTMAILLLDRWLQPPPTTLPSISSRLVCSACHWYDEPIAHSEKIFNHVSRTRGWWWWWWLLRRWW